MPFINSIVNWFNIKRIYNIELFKKHPFDVQKDTFNNLISRALNTEWGKKYGYHEEMTIEEYQNTVPLQNYDQVKHWIERIKNGEQNLLWPSEIKWFAKSSGTTSDKSKYIPVSNESLEDCHFRGARDVLALYSSNYPNSGVLKGKSLTLAGSHQINNLNNYSFSGDLSAILIENMPFIATFIQTPSSDIALLTEWENKLERITKHTITENVTVIVGVPSWMLVLLNYILDYTGKKNILEIWPNLELFTHGGVSFAPYKKSYKQIIPSSDMHYMETYNASEGFFAIQDNPDTDDMLLMLDYGVFYEFIPFENINDPDPPVYTIKDVELHKNYAIVISSNTGLWRYIIGDTVIFTSLFPHKIKISGRTKHFINAFGEEVIIDNAEKALMTAAEKTGAIINEYTAAPVYMSNNTKGSHEWLIEFKNEPENMEIFINTLDEALKSLNSDYEAKRYKNFTLVAPVVKSIPKGTFYKWFELKGKLGGQNKMPRLSNDRKYVEEIYNLLK